MKKLVICMVSILILVATTACDRKQEMTIMPSEFSEETQEVLKIIDQQLAYYDYNVDETIQSLAITVWNYDDGEWVDMGGVNGEIGQTENRIALQTTQAGLEIFTIDDTGHSKAAFQNEVIFAESMATAETRLVNPADIVVGEEITLWMKVGNEGNSIKTFADKDFRKVECDKGIAITITFFDKPTE